MTPRVRLALLPALLLVGGAAGAGAQHPEVALGQRVSGRLETTDPELSDDSHYDLWLFRGSRGQSVTITLRSEDFDAYLSWGVWNGKTFTGEESDDDSGDGTDARLTVTLGGDAVYAIRANSYGADETGRYTLLVEPFTLAPVTALPIRTGQTLSGRLEESDALMEDDSWFDLYLYSGSPGEQVRVTLRSEDFDAYLAVGEWDGTTFVATGSDDDGGGDTDATLSATVGETGTLAVRANSLRGGESGGYTLVVEREGDVRRGTGAAARPGALPRPLPPAEAAAGAGPPPAESVPPTTVQVGQTVQGRLEAGDLALADGSHYDLYLLPPQAEAGAELVVTLTSPDFDAYLSWGVVEGGVFRQLAFDDDGGGGTHARLVVTLGASAAYAIRARSLKGGVRGAYTLTVLPSGR